MRSTLPLLEETDFPVLFRTDLEVLQVNLGYRCNQSCVHCHVNAGPTRKENMTRSTADQVLEFLHVSGAYTLDLTGGAPELNPNFRHMVEAARALGVHVIDRCNLTILEEPGQENLAEFLATHGVEVVASLPCYLEQNVDAQRGEGVFERSIRGVLRLNALGYGGSGTDLILNLVHNPQGATLPPPQAALETEYRTQLRERFGIEFTRLLTLTNMPIQRYGSMLVSRGRFDEYMAILKAAHRPENLESVMCLTLLSVDWQGYAYDCDFNQLLGIPLHLGSSRRIHVKDLLGVNLRGNPIRVADHCYGCTAGQGSGCGGAL